MAKAGILYVGTDGGLLVFSDPGGVGRWRQRGPAALPDERVRGLVVADALSLLVATERALLRSDDGGATWREASPADAELLDYLAPGRPLVATAQGISVWRTEHPPAAGADVLALLAGKQEVLLAAIADGTSLVRSDDGGRRWATVDLPQVGQISALMPSSYHMDIVWGGTDAGQILRSDDRGRSWQEVARVGSAVRCLAAVRLA